MRIGFFGTPEAAVPALRAFVDDARTDVAVVVTNPDRPRGRGHALQPPPVKVAATAAGIPVLQPAKPAAVIDDLAGLDACAVVAYGRILPAAVLAAPRHGFVNLHFSLLPAWRGAAPVPATILSGQRETGVTCFVLDEGMDTGPVLSTATTTVGPTEDAGALIDRLAVLGAPLLVDAVVGLVDGSLSPRPQDHGRATYAPKISPADAALDWSLPAEALDRRVRAHQPVPGAHTTFAGARLKVHTARIVPGDGPPGTVIGTDERTHAPIVACGTEALRLDEVQPAGRRRMSGEAFVNGYQPVGELLG